MNSKKLTGLEKGVQDIQFQIKPKSVVFKDKIAKCFALYLQKGVQVLGCFQSGSNHNTKDTIYRFRMPESIYFRMKSTSHATYTWNLYNVDPEDGTQTFFDAVNFDLKSTVQLYQAQLKERENDLHIVLKDKSLSRKSVLEAWNRVRKQIKTRRFFLNSIFSNSSIHIEFQINIYNLLDLQVREERKLRRSRSENNQLRIMSLRSNSDPIQKMPPALPTQDQNTSKLIQYAKIAHENGLQSKTINVSSSPQLHNPQPAAEENFQTKEDDTRVVVVNPSGMEVEEKYEEIQAQNFQKKLTYDDTSKNQLFLPIKRFQTLSDIIERSHQGSSNYDYGKMSSSNGGFRKFPDKIDEIPDAKQEQKDNSPLLKVRTLPQEGTKKKIFKGADLNGLRRAQTAQKMKHITEQSEYAPETLKNQSDAGTAGTIPKPASTSGDQNAKYILGIALFIIFSIIGGQLFFSKSKNKSPALKKNQKKPKPMK